MSIWASSFSIEDEREWIADLEAAGIKAGVIRDGDPLPEDLDAPIIYQGSHVLPEDDSEQGGYVHLAVIPRHVRFWRDNPDAPTSEEPDGPPPEPFLRISVGESKKAPELELGQATVIIHLEQARRLASALAEFCSHFAEEERT